MTIYYIHGKPHIAICDAFRPITDKEVYDLLESNEPIHFEDVMLYD